MKIEISGRIGGTSQRDAERMVNRGIARWCIDSRSGLVSNTRIEFTDTSVQLRRTPVPSWGPNLGAVIQHIEDAFPGWPTLPVIGYDRRSVGV
jgi:hypothetical protein